MEAPERQLLAQEAARLGSPLDEGQLERLSLYADNLRIWNMRVRMLGDRDPQALIRKHLPDCLALLPLLPDAGAVADIGSGAGLPGMVLACVRTDLEFWLIESRRRRVSFLKEVKARLSLDKVLVLDDRAEEISGRPGFAAKAAVVTARAVSLEDLMMLGLPLMDPTGRILAMQSRRDPIDQTRTVVGRNHLAVLDVREYRLMGGEERRIVILGRP